MLQIKNISKQYKTGDLVQNALKNVSLNFRDNEFVSILGPSGSGKTTLLNIIGGLDRYDSGDLIINNVSTKNYKDRDWDSYRNHTIGFVFQSYNLIPHQSVLSNVELALTISGISKKERRKRALDALEKVGLREQAHKKPSQMSGGQMQRVAIARALVNNPDILLADEPTGALDTETSVQVMELLKQVANDRLVIMVTHNPELAEEYSTRIVKLKDGEIIGDTDPFELKGKNESNPEHKNLGKSSMSFLTALSLSFNNLLTKKGRTILTSFAGSIGIIGIALILSLSTGFQNYIYKIQEDTLTSYQLSITAETADTTAMLLSMVTESEEEIEGELVKENQAIVNMFSKIGTNDLKSFKAHLEENEDKVDDMVSLVRYQYSVSPLIYTKGTTNEIRQINPSKMLSSFGGGMENAAMMGPSMGMSIFNEMIDDEEMIDSQYDVLKGRLPQNYDEVIMILPDANSISDLLLYSLELKDSKELQDMISKIMKEEKVENTASPLEFTYEELMNIELKLVDATDTYKYNSKYDIYESMVEDEEFMKNVYENSTNLKIVGIAIPKDDSSSLMSGIGYTKELTEYVIDKASKSEIVQKQLANEDINVFSNKRFDDDSDKTGLNFDNMISVDTQMLTSAFSMNVTKEDMSNITKKYMNEISKDIQENLIKSQKDYEKSLNELEDKFNDYIEKNKIDTSKELTIEEVKQYLKKFSEQEDVKAIIEKLMDNVSKEKIEEAMSAKALELTNSLMKEMTSKIRVDQRKIARAFKFNLNEDEIKRLFETMSTSSSMQNAETNLISLGYQDLNKPTSISFYFKDFDSKESFIEFIDNYNKEVEKEDEEKVIKYTDVTGFLMSSVKVIIDSVSYVLIAFVSISLIVSSIMIGIITYISVLERTKEIGVLRAIGASKKNISSIFNAETFIVGLFAGVLGILVTLALLIPINFIIHTVTGNNDITAVLPASGGITLVILSVILTLIGGIIPSKTAAKKDPVIALRSE